MFSFRRPLSFQKALYITTLLAVLTGCTSHMRTTVLVTSSHLKQTQHSINLVLLGAPGSGKGTLGVRLKDNFGLCHISTGEMVRAEIANKTEFGNMVAADTHSGKLLADGQPGMEHLMELVKARMQSSDCAKGFILDGFPRTLWQAQELDKMLAIIDRKVDSAILLDVKEQTVLDRLSGRLTCTNKACGMTFHEKLGPPKVANKCDTCGSPLVKRVDDQESAAVQTRFRAYVKNPASVFEYYRNCDKL